MSVYDGDIFMDRIDAGERLAEKLDKYRGRDAVVFGIPRGGVPVGIEVARKIGAAFDVVITRKIAMPHNPEAGYGAVTEDGDMVLNEDFTRRLRLTGKQVREHAEKVRAEIARRSAVLRERLNPSSVGGKTAIIVDDGLATGYTMLAAIKSLKRREPSGIVAAAPVSSDSAFELIRPVVDEIVSVIVSSAWNFAVAGFYRAWSDMTDEEVFERIADWLASQTEMNGYFTPAAAM